MWKNIFRTIIIVFASILLILIFIAPWLWIDGGEDLLESRFFRGREAEIFSKFDDDCRSGCDGSCYKIKWVPFGVKVNACSIDYYYVPFYGGEFYVNGE